MTTQYDDTTEDAQATQQPDHDDLLEVPVRPPREPAAYRPTDHFLQRLRERVPEYDSDLPRRLIEDGTAARVHGDSVDDDLKYGTPVGFTDTVEGKPWTVVVALRPAAFVDGDDVKHRALTVFQGTPTPAGQDSDARGEHA